MTKWQFSGLALVALTSCADAGDGETWASTSQPIIYGKASTAEQDSVVQIVHRVQGATDVSICTGTIVAPNLILTARHCVSETGPGGFSCDAEGNFDNDGDGAGVTLDDHQPADLYVYTGRNQPKADTKPAGQGKTIFHDDHYHTCNHDLALIQLKSPIPGAIVATIRLDSATRKGETITAVGWGVTETGSDPAVRQQRTGVAIRQVGPFAGSETDFQVAPNEFSVGESTCQGDSGGPGFSEETGAVIGIVARGGNGESDPRNPAVACMGATHDYMKTSAFKNVILTAFAAAGYDPKVEPPRREDPPKEPDPPKENPSTEGSSKACSMGPAGPSSPAFGAALFALGIIAIGLRRNRARVVSPSRHAS